MLRKEQTTDMLPSIYIKSYSTHRIPGPHPSSDGPLYTPGHCALQERRVNALQLHQLWKVIHAPFCPFWGKLLSPQRILSVQVGRSGAGRAIGNLS